MKFIEFIQKFFGLIDSGVPGNYLDTTHIIVATIVSILALGLGIFFGILYKDKDEKAKTKLLLIFAIIMWALYACRVFMIIFRNYYRGGNGLLRYIEGDLPLFFCDIQFFALIGICFGKGKIKKAGLDLCICLGILSFAMGVWLNAGTYGGNPFWTSCYIYEQAVHAIPGGIALFIPISRLGSLKLKDIWVTYIVFGFFAAIALVLDYTIDSNYMFFIRDAGTPFFIFTNWAHGNTPLYSLFVFLGMAAFIVVYYSVWELVAFIIRKIKERRVAA